MRARLSMRQALRFANRNLRRHTRRTIITAAAVAVGLMLFILVDSLLLGIEQDSDRNVIWYETGSAQVVQEDYPPERDMRPLKYALDDPGIILSRLEEAGLPATPRTVFTGEMIVFFDPYPEDGSVNVIAYGIDPASDDEVFRLSETVSEGEYLQPGSNQVLIGAWLAEDLDAEVGYPLILVTRTREGYYQTMDLEIAGIVRTPNPIINRRAIFLPLDVADGYLQMNGGVTEIAVSAPLGASLNELTADMREALTGITGVAVLDWRQLATDAVAMAEAKRGSTGLILFLVFIIAAVGISNTLLMSIMERTPELGMMRAMGMRDGEVRLILLTEAAGIGLLGGVIGVILGGAAVLFLANVGIDYGFMIRNMDIGYRLSGIMYGAWNPAAFIQALAAGVVISITTALLPVRRALKMRVIDALHTGKGVM